MPIPKKYIHDKIVLLMLSIMAFLILLCAVLVLINLDGGQTSSYIVQYRANLGISAYKTGNSIELISFVVFVAFVAVVQWVLSMRVYHLRRDFSIALLSLGVLLQVIAIIVSFSLLQLR